MRYILDRLREPSTYAGLAALLSGLGLFGFSEVQWNELFGVLASLAGAVAIFMGDGSANPDDEISG